MYVFGFHPIHLMLNSPDAETYFELREGWHRGEPLSTLRHDGYGTYSFYDDLLTAMAKAGVPSVTLEAALEAYLAADFATASS